MLLQNNLVPKSVRPFFTFPFDIVLLKYKSVALLYLAGMGTLWLSVGRWFVRYTSKSLIKNILVISLCLGMVFVQLFFPYNYYASAQRSQKPFTVGIHYVYEQDSLSQIQSEVARIHDLGFKVIRITLECHTTPDFPRDEINDKTDLFFSVASQMGLEVSLVIKNTDTPDAVNYYLDHWGNYLSYIQVLNEPELSSSWAVGALFTDDEIISKFNSVCDLVVAHNLPAKLYTNFGVGYVLRSNVPIELSKRLDFVGLDVFMDSFLVLSPHFIQNLQAITGKEVVITEFGMSTSDTTTQSAFLLKGLNLFKSMGLPGCWLVYWNSQLDDYGIRNRTTETDIGAWINANAA